MLRRGGLGNQQQSYPAAANDHGVMILDVAHVDRRLGCALL